MYGNSAAEKVLAFTRVAFSLPVHPLYHIPTHVARISADRCLDARPICDEPSAFYTMTGLRQKYGHSGVVATSGSFGTGLETRRTVVQSH
jgi:hypothetical protein